jgi:hypothetical protein
MMLSYHPVLYLLAKERQEALQRQVTLAHLANQTQQEQPAAHPRRAYRRGKIVANERGWFSLQLRWKAA